MKITRRKALQMLSWTIALPAVVGLQGRRAAAATLDERAVDEAAALDFFTKAGFALVPAMDLITNQAFNEGLRFDDTPNAYPPGRTLRIQGCIRMDDLSKRTQPGFLPYFHILSLSAERPAYRGELLMLTLDYLVTQAKLAHEQLALVSTEHFKPYLPLLSRIGIEPGQVVQRDLGEAKAKGDGSGYFMPKGHPDATGQHTVSIHYTPEPTHGNAGLEYPLPRYLELGEVVIEPDLAKVQAHEVAGLGLERLLLAQGHAMESFDESLKEAEKALEAEALRRGVSLPAGYDKLRAAISGQAGNT
jgi:hypothetical protein